MRELLRNLKCAVGFHEWVVKRQKPTLTHLLCIYCPAEKYEVIIGF